MTTAGGQIPIFCPKTTPNIDIIQRTSIFAPFDNAKQPQIYIQDKVLWYLFKINCETLGGNPIYGDPGGIPLYTHRHRIRLDFFQKPKHS